jgi:uncharacterized cupin superfamily protein
MKTFKIKDKAHYQDDFSEWVLGPIEFGNKIGYMAWGELGPGEKRAMETGDSHEEIILVLEGEATLKGGKVVETGTAFFLPAGGNSSITAGPKGCTYVTAGAHVK